MSKFYKIIFSLSIAVVFLTGFFAFYQIATGSDQCQLGDRMCVSDRTFKVCGDYDNDGDLEWSQIYSCFLGQYCSLGRCYDPNVTTTNPAPPSCTNECTISERRCSADGKYQICGNYDTDPCTEWSTAYSCPTGQTCQGNGVCTATCTNQCAPSDKMCVSNTSYKTCTLNSDTGCYVWSSLINQCPYNTTCANGICTANPAPPSCTNECTSSERRCSADGKYQICGNYDTDSCTEWSTAYSCPTGQTCQGNGVCTATCTNQCAPLGQWVCVLDNSYKICQDTNNDGCLEWTPTYNCASGLYCSESQKACLVKNDNPATITFTANKSVATINDTVQFTIEAKDEDGVEKICFVDNNFLNNPECFNCSQKTCQKDFFRTKQTPGLYVFSAYAFTKKPDGTSALVSANPLSVLFSSPISTCSDECPTNGISQCQGDFAMKFCGNYDSDPCLEWSALISCSEGQICSSVNRFCQYPDNKQTSGIIQLSHNYVCFENQPFEITITVSGNDADGVEKVCYVDSLSGALNCQNCNNATTCQKTWKKSLNTSVGDVYFYGKVYGKNPLGTLDVVNTTPEWQKITIKTCCENECSQEGALQCFGNTLKSCQKQSNSCLSWVVWKDCGNDVSTNEYRCANNNTIVQRKIIRKGCSANNCYETPEWLDYDNCQAKGMICNSTTNTCESLFLEASCFAAPATAKRGELAWVVARVSGGVGPYQYLWSGDFSGTEQTVSRTFFNKGTYNAYLTVTAGGQTKTASCSVNVSDQLAPYANHEGQGSIWVSQNIVYTGEPFTISIFGADEDGINEIQAYYQNSWHSQSLSGTGGTKIWHVAEYVPNRYLYCGKIIGRDLNGQRDVSYTNPRCIEVVVRSR
jgi:hypothetical protein